MSTFGHFFQFSDSPIPPLGKIEYQGPLVFFRESQLTFVSSLLTLLQFRSAYKVSNCFCICYLPSQRPFLWFPFFVIMNLYAFFNYFLYLIGVLREYQGKGMVHLKCSFQTDFNQHFNQLKCTFILPPLFFSPISYWQIPKPM